VATTAANKGWAGMESGGGWVGEASDVGRRGGQRVPAGLVRCTQGEDKRDLGKKRKEISGSYRRA
jgi:hypothetical protein